MSSLVIQYSSTVPEVAPNILDLLQQGASLAYGSGVVQLESVPEDMLDVQERLACQRNDVVLFLLTPKDTLEEIHEGSLVIKSVADVVGYFASLGVDLPTSEEPAPSPSGISVGAQEPSKQYEFTLRQYQKQIEALEQALAEKELALPSAVDSSKISELQHKLDKALETVASQETLLNSKVSEAERDTSKITELLEQNVQLQQQVDDLSGSVNSDTELVRLRRQLSQLEASPMFKLNKLMSPTSTLQIALPYTANPKHKGIHFVYAGSDGSMKLTYEVVRRLSGELSTQGKVVVLDLTTETYIDYILNIPKVVSATDWFMSGGALPLSDTRLSNVKVLSAGLQYFNDLSLLCVNWSERWTQLLQEGYQVIVIFGVLNTVVTRVLYNSFGFLNKPWIVVDGLITTLRSLIIHLSGLSAQPRVLINHLNPNAQALYQHLVETVDVTLIDSVDRLASL